MDFRNFLKKIEYFADRSVPYCVIALIVILVSESFFQEFSGKYSLQIDITYGIVMGLFVVDLIFKYARIHDFRQFFRKYWLDVIAVFPFYLLFRTFEELLSVFRISENIREAQIIFHEGLEVEKVLEGETKLLKAAQAESAIVKEGSAVQRILRVALRSPRLLRARVFFRHTKKPKHKEHKKKRGK